MSDPVGNEPIVVSSVSKTFRIGLYKKKTAVSDLSFSVPRGDIVGLLGPNGSGKSTTMKMILGFLRPTEGEITLCGKPAEARAARSFIGYLPENARFPRFLRGREALRYYGSLLGLSGVELTKRIEESLTLVDMRSAADERIQGYSKGMQQRLSIAQAILNRPPVLIFDEPMSGLDPLGRIEIRSLIVQIHKEIKDSTILFSSHILSDIEQLCSSVLLLRQGRLTRRCDIHQLLEDEAQRFDVLITHASPALHERYLSVGARVTPAGLALNIEGIEKMLELVADTRKSGARIAGIQSHRKSLEEALFSDRIQNSLNTPTSETR